LVISDNFSPFFYCKDILVRHDFNISTPFTALYDISSMTLSNVSLNKTTGGDP